MEILLTSHLTILKEYIAKIFKMYTISIQRRIIKLSTIYYLLFSEFTTKDRNVMAYINSRFIFIQQKEGKQHEGLGIYSNKCTVKGD